MTYRLKDMVANKEDAMNDQIEGQVSDVEEDLRGSWRHREKAGNSNVEGQTWTFFHSSLSGQARKLTLRQVKSGQVRQTHFCSLPHTICRAYTQKTRSRDCIVHQGSLCMLFLDLSVCNRLVAQGPSGCR